MPSISPTARISELEAVNTVLSNIGQSPVNDLTTASVDVAMAIRHLSNVSREVQMRGWSFNVDHDYELTADGNSRIALTSAMLAIDTDREDYPELDLVIRGDNLYNRYNNSYDFTGTIKVEVTWLIPWDELPPHAQNYITVSAALRMADDVESGTVSHSFSQEDQLHAWNAFKSQEVDTNDANLIRYTRSASLRRRGW